jgi:hypothetical protein
MPKRLRRIEPNCPFHERACIRGDCQAYKTKREWKPGERELFLSCSNPTGIQEYVEGCFCAAMDYEELTTKYTTIEALEEELCQEN